MHSGPLVRLPTLKRAGRVLCRTTSSLISLCACSSACVWFVPCILQNEMLEEGQEYAVMLYTWRSCSRAIPQVPYLPHLSQVLPGRIVSHPLCGCGMPASFSLIKTWPWVSFFMLRWSATSSLIGLKFMRKLWKSLNPRSQNWWILCTSR